MKFESLLLAVGLAVFSTLQATYAQDDLNPSSAMVRMQINQPPYLKAGDSVAIVAPSGILKARDAEIDRAIALLKSWGLEVVVGKHVFKQAGHFAGTDSERVEDFQQALDDPSIKAIWSARGGYGTVRVIDHLNYDDLIKQPKWIIGYSDITALHNELHNLGMESIHAIMCTSLPEKLSDIEASILSLKKALFGESLTYEIKGHPKNKTGEASGQLVGGNLTLLHTMLGSRSDVDTSGKIVFIEEIGEYAYHIDRMLMSLKRAGFFDQCNGLIVGDISKVRRNTTPWGKPVKQLILDAFADYDFPILFDFPAGHEDDNRAMILGRQVELIVGRDVSKLSFK